MKAHLIAEPLSFLLLVTSCFAQGTMPPTVSVRATDPVGSRSGDSAEFTIYRDGDASQELNVYHYLYGTAENGVDYVKVPNWTVMASGVTSAVVKIQPIAVAGAPSVETVVLQLDYPPMTGPVNYGLGEPRTAVVYLGNSEGTNLPPVVRITVPRDGMVLAGPTNLTLVAEAVDLDPAGYIDTVEFFANGTSLGTKTNNPVSASPVNPFLLDWKDVVPGDYSLTARATDDKGASTLSNPVHLRVRSWPEQVTVVEVVASQSNAAEPCLETPAVRGRFTFSRNVGIDMDLPVHFVVRGTARAGLDYEPITNVVVIPRGAESADLEITPLADSLGEGVEGVALQLVQLACIAIYPPPLDCYLVGRQSQAVVLIEDCAATVTNAPPVVKMTGPPNGAVFFGSLDLPLFAFAVDPDGSVAEVEFFANDKSLGVGHQAVPSMRMVGTNLYTLTWTNAPVGVWSLTAKATDAKGASANSAPVNISIVELPPPATNRPNVVSIMATDPIGIEGTNCWPALAVSSGESSWTNWLGHPVRVVTNCGPNNAMFTVRRLGATNDPLTVTYSIGGTALNGVDYIALPGMLVIPAGERRAVIPVVPLDSEMPHTNTTVVLRLEPSTQYLVGMPGRAAALLVDSEAPHWFTSMLPGGAFHLNAAGPDGAWFRVEHSSDLVHWYGIATNQVVNGSIDFIDSEAGRVMQGYYRAVPEIQQPVE